MEWEFIAPMVITIVFFVVTGGVIILRPLSKRAADLLELYARDRESGLVGELGRVREVLETVDARLRLLEERQDFTERLLGEDRLGEARRLQDSAGGTTSKLSGPPGGSDGSSVSDRVSG